MREKYYLDTCVWIAKLDKKHQHHEIASGIFEKLRWEKALIIVTNLHARETSNKGFYEDYVKEKDKLFNKRLCIGIKIFEIVREIAFSLNEKLKVGYWDCLHMQVAERVKAKPVSFDEDWQIIGRKLNIRVYHSTESL